MEFLLLGFIVSASAIGVVGFLADRQNRKLKEAEEARRAELKSSVRVAYQHAPADVTSRKIAAASAAVSASNSRAPRKPAVERPADIEVRRDDLSDSLLSDVSTGIAVASVLSSVFDDSSPSYTPEPDRTTGGGGDFGGGGAESSFSFSSSDSSSSSDCSSSSDW